MGFLKSKKKRKRAKLREWGAIRCPLNGHQVGPCRQLCEPLEGVGQCGRDAPHGLIGRTQAAIRAQQARRDGQSSES